METMQILIGNYFLKANYYDEKVLDNDTLIQKKLILMAKFLIPEHGMIQIDSSPFDVDIPEFNIRENVDEIVKTYSKGLCLYKKNS